MKYTENKLFKELLGLSSMNSFMPHNSPSRSVMYLTHMSQHLSLINPEPKVLLSGLERELIGGNMGITLPKNSKILYILPYEVNDYIISVKVIFHNLDTNVIDMVNIPRFGKNDKHFGFEQRWTESLMSLEEEQIIRRDVKLTKTNSEVSDFEHGFGLNANVAYVSDVEIAEDPIVISESFANRLTFNLYETKVFEFGKDTIPINLYGDDDIYKILPEVGETVGDHGIIASLRKMDEDVYPALFNKEALRKPDPVFDKTYYSRGSNGEVIDIKVMDTPMRNRTRGYTRTYDQIEKYADAARDQREALIRAVQEIETDFPQSTIGHELHVESVNAMMIEHPRVTKYWNRETLDIWRVEVVIKHTIVPTRGFKITTTHGS